jgi:hypothetical protein
LSGFPFPKSRSFFIALPSKQIDWSVFDSKFGTLYVDRGRPELPTRLMVGLHYQHCRSSRANASRDDHALAKQIEDIRRGLEWQNVKPDISVSAVK